MRLIDADAAKRKIIKETIAHFSKLDDRAFAIMTAVAKMFDSEDDFPTVDAKPVRHGKWIRECFTYCRCTVCTTEFDKELLYFTYRHNWKRPVYCPNCGAKMDGGEENELDRR